MLEIKTFTTAAVTFSFCISPLLKIGNYVILRFNDACKLTQMNTPTVTRINHQI